MTFDEFKEKFPEIIIPDYVKRSKDSEDDNCPRFEIDEILYYQNNDGSGFCIGSYTEKDGNKSFVVRWNSEKLEFPYFLDKYKNKIEAWLIVPNDKEILKTFTKEFFNLI